jgi:hypothetical protein
MDAELENDSQTYDAFTKGCEEGRITGLKEALEIIQANPWLTAGSYAPILNARISSLSPKEKE